MDRSGLINLLNLVVVILNEDERARRDDSYLIAKVWEEYKPAIIYSNFYDVMTNKPSDVPSFESITRARRKAFEKFPDLNPKLAIRDEQLEEFEKFVKEI